MWRWIAYIVLVLWLSSALLELIILVMRVIHRTQYYGRPQRSTLSYFIGGVLGLLVYGTLAWGFYWNYIDEFWVIVLGTILSLPEIAYVTWLVYSASPPAQNDQADGSV